MKKTDIFSLVLTPILLILLGLVLLVSPDSASALISNILGWALIAAAVGCGIAAIASANGRLGKVLCAIVFAAAGGWLHQHPLLLASVIGRFCGIFMAINGIQSIRRNRALGRGSLLPWIAAVVGFALFLIVPLSVSRFVFSLCGLVILIMGAAMLLSNLRSNKRLPGSEDSDIIDAL